MGESERVIESETRTLLLFSLCASGLGASSPLLAKPSGAAGAKSKEHPMEERKKREKLQSLHTETLLSARISVRFGLNALLAGL